jgi:Fe-S cluster assembly iron-binding protein IscA
MLTISDKAVSVLKAAKLTEGAPADAGVRIQRAEVADDHGMIAVSLAIRNGPVSSDKSFEQDGQRIFIEDALVEPLDGRMLDVREDSDGTALVLR